jgi:hypothetical protein
VSATTRIIIIGISAIGLLHIPLVVLAADSGSLKDTIFFSVWGVFWFVVGLLAYARAPRVQ